MSEAVWIAVDVGNQRTKLGRFAAGAGAAAVGSGVLPEPTATLTLADDDWSQPTGVQRALEPWLRGESAASRANHPPLSDATVHWWIGSVNRPSGTRLLDWIRTQRPHDAVTLLVARDVPLRVGLARPDMVGIDRLLDAVAANALREPQLPAVVVDAGTAITVDLISREGVFEGGAILPGLTMSARALHEFTDLLPLLDAAELSAPPAAVGKETVLAMQAGLFWGAVGAIRELVGRMAGDDAEIFLTGGAGAAVGKLLGPRARCVPHLTLSGIALAAH